MKRFLIVAGFTTVLLAGCAKSPYTIRDRTSQGPGGIATQIEVEVPYGATKEDMQTWCDTISSKEPDPKMVTVEFLDTAGFVRQKGLCVGGKLYVTDETPHAIMH